MSENITGSAGNVKSLRDRALEYASMGWHVFPCVEGGREPACKHSFKEATRDPKRIHELWHNPNFNIGCAPDLSGLFVLDVDMKNGKDGNATLAKLMAENGQLPDTMTVATPNGGYHLYFKGKAPTTTGYIGPGLDTRGAGGYAVMPGSIVDGKAYEETIDTGCHQEQIADATAWLIELASQKREKAPASPAKGTPVPEAHLRMLLSYLDPGADYDTWRNIVAACGSAPVEGDDDRQLRRQIAHEFSEGKLDRLKRYEDAHPSNYTGPEAVDLVFDTMPPKEDGGAAYGTIYKAATKAGYVGPPARPRAEEVFKDRVPMLQDAVAGEAKAEAKIEVRKKPSRFYPVGMEEMEDQPPTRWLVQDLIQQGRTVMLVGETASYKSFLALDLALAVATGSPTFGTMPLATGPTFYCALEGLHDIKGNRRASWLAARGVTDKAPFFALPAPLVSSASMCQEFIEQLKECRDQRCGGQQPQLIVLETINKIMSGMNENDAKDATVFVSFCDQLVDEFGCTVIAVHHKSDKHGSSDVRGSSAFQAGFDTVLQVERNKATKTASVKVTKHKDAPERPEPWTFKMRNVGLSLVADPTSAVEHIEVTRNHDPYSRKSVADALKRLGAIGPDNAVTTAMLAEDLDPLGSLDDPEDGKREKRLSSAQRLLNRRGEPGKELYGYCYPGERPRSPSQWYLPAGEGVEPS